MAKLVKTIEVRLGNVVRFRIKEDLITGRVQDISNFPDVIYIETGDPKNGDYRRYCVSLYMIEENLCYDQWKEEHCEFEQHEPLEFVYNKDLETIRVTSKYDEKRGKITVHKRKNFRSSQKNGND